MITVEVARPPRTDDFVRAIAAVPELADYFVWAGMENVAAFGVRAALFIEDDTVRIVDGSGRLVASAPAVDPFAVCGRLLAEHVEGPFRAYGYLAFDLARFRYPCRRGAARDLHVVVPRLVADLRDGHALLCGDEQSVKAAQRALATVCTSGPGETAERTDLEASIREGRDVYLDGLATVLAAIRRNEVEKVILARRVALGLRLDPLGTFQESAAVQAARRFAFRFGDVAGAGACPELVMLADGKGNVVTNPLAGTRPRGLTPEEDAVLQRELLSDPKELSEHAQSIRLAYEELRTVVTPETARVVDFMQVKHYRFTQHLSSRAAGTLAPGRTSWDALNAFFPGVTVTGVPKPAALELVRQLEPHPRRIYGGAAGWVDASGAMDWGIAIRSVFDYGEGAILNAGAGIVRDSDPDFEFEESVSKMRTIASRLVLHGA